MNASMWAGRPPRPSMAACGVGADRRVALALGMVVAASGMACRDGSTAPNLPPAPPAPRAKPEVGPWFVDRAPDFGLAVITRCGSPEKPSILHSLGSGVALFDADGDGDLDLFVAAGSAVRGGDVVPAGGPWLYRNDGPGRWSDASERSGLRWTGWAQGVAVADYDGDGDLDLFVAQHGQDTLWRNRGRGTFEDSTVDAGIREKSWGVSATWGDIDLDGDLDLFVSNYLVVDALRPPPMHSPTGVPIFRGPAMLEGEPDQLWRNRGDGTFEDATAEAGLDRPYGKGMSALFVDLDFDGKLDLYVTNDGQANELFRGLGDGKFREEAMASGVAVDPHGRAEGSMGIEVADADGDGRLDIAISNFQHEGTRLYRDLGDRTYQDISSNSRIHGTTLGSVGWGLILADFDEDGLPDLFQANGHVYPGMPDGRYAQPPILMRNLGRGAFEGATAAWGRDLQALRSGRGVAAGDIDGDGDLDLVMTTIDGPLRVLVDEGRRTNHAASLRLVGRPPNREAIGARVELRAGGRARVGVVKRGGGFLSASDVALHFGLGDAEAISSVEVRWPDGSHGRYHDLPADAHLTIRQGDDRATATPFSPAYPTESHRP